MFIATKYVLFYKERIKGISKRDRKTTRNQKERNGRNKK